MLDLPFEKRTIVQHQLTAGRGGIVIPRPAAIEQRVQAHPLGHVRDARQAVGASGRPRRGGLQAADVIPVKMSEYNVVQLARGPHRVHPLNVTRDPLSGAQRGVGARGRIVTRFDLFFPIAGARIQQHSGAVRQYEEGRVSRAGVDVMNVEHSSLPARQRLPRHRSQRDGNSHTEHRQRQDSRTRSDVNDKPSECRAEDNHWVDAQNFTVALRVALTGSV